MIDDSVKKEDLADPKEPESTLQQEMRPKVKAIKTASVSELISFSKFTLSGVVVFLAGLGIQAILQQIQFVGYDRWVLAVIGSTILFFFGCLVIDILNWRDYTEWGALGAIISYFGVLLIFIPFPLNILLYEEVVEGISFIYIIMFILGVITMIIGFTTRATEFDQKIEHQLFLFKEWIKAGGIRQALSALKQLIGTIVRGFLRYIGLGIKELGTRIKRFGGWIIQSTKFIVGHLVIFLTKTFPNLLARSLIGLWNNLHWLGLIAVIFYLIMVDIPVPTADPLILKVELSVIIGFFFCLGVLYPQRDRVVQITKSMRKTVLTGVISMYSMLSGTKIQADQSVFCSRCLRGVNTREFQSLVEIKGMIDPPCPFCGFNNWIGSEYVSISLEKLKPKEEHEVRAAQKTMVKEPAPSEITLITSDKKAIRKGKFPDYQSYQRAQDLGARTYSELEYIDRLEAPDLITAEKIKKSGFSHFETYQKALNVGASSVSDLHLVEELHAPDLATAKAIQKGEFPDYKAYQRAQELGAKNYSDLQYIDRLGAPDFETAEQIRIGGFRDYKTYEKAQSVRASNKSELRLVEDFQAPDLATAKEILQGGFPDYLSYQQAQNLGVRTYSELQFATKKVEKPSEVETRVSQKDISTNVTPRAKATVISEPFRFTKDRESLKLAIEFFDEIFTDLTLPPPGVELVLWYNKKNWFSNQKKRYLKGNISTGMFYDKMKSLYRDLRSNFKIPEERLQVIRSQPDKKCPFCGVDIFPETSQYCRQCGAKLPN
ncbi:MAG: hypothetical protein ACFFFH_05910 [Candidatus Thorarchaeota archaeon]